MKVSEWAAASPAVSTARPSPVAAATVCFAALILFLFALLQPTVPNYFLLDTTVAWTLVCYAFALPVITIQLWRGRWPRPSSFDYVLWAYLAAVVLTYPTSIDHAATLHALVTLAGQIAVFCAVRTIVVEWPVAARFIIVLLVGGLVVLGWAATDVHLRLGIGERLLLYPSLEWNGRQGLATLALIQFAALLGIWQQADSTTLRVSVLVLLAMAIAELILFYARDPWVAAVVVAIAAMVVAIRLGRWRRHVWVVGIAAVVVASVRPRFVWQLVKTATGFAPPVEAGGPYVRLAAWADALSMIRDHPLFGVGLGNYVAARHTMPSTWSYLIPPGQDAPIHPHNLFLHQTAELGLVGGAIYLALWALALWLGWKSIRSAIADRDVSVASLYAVLAIAAANCGENVFLDAVAAERVRLHTIAWLVMGVAIAGYDRVRLRDPATVAARRPAFGRRATYVFLGVAAGVAAYESWAVFIRSVPAVTIQGAHRRAIAEFGAGAPIMQMFQMTGGDLAAVEVQVSAAAPTNLLVDCKLIVADRAAGSNAVIEWLATLKSVSGVVWRRIAIPPTASTNGRDVHLVMRLVSAVPPPQAHDGGASAPRDGRGVALVASQENVSGGGALWIGDRRQIGSLALRAFASERTGYALARAQLAPVLPAPLRHGAVVVVLIVGYQLALLAFVASWLDEDQISD